MNIILKEKLSLLLKIVEQESRKMNKYIYSNKLAKLKGKRFFKMKNLELASHIVKAQSIK